MNDVLQTGWLTADFFTHSYRISGQVDVRRQSIADILNSQASSFIELEDSYVSPIHRPGDIIASYGTASLVKANLTFVLVPQQDDALSRKQVYGSYYGTNLQSVFLTVPMFEIAGYLRLSGKVDVRHILAGDSEGFLCALDAKVRASIQPDVLFTGGGVLINKHEIGALCLSEEE